MDLPKATLFSETLSKETSWLSALLIGLLTFHLVRLWMKVRELPPGPFPLPFIGNILTFRGKRSVTDTLMALKKKYGGIFTVWVAERPFIIVSDWELAKEGLIQRRNDIISRGDFRSFTHVQKEVMSIVNEKNDRKWEVTRKVGGAAIRKFVDGENLATIVMNDTNEFVSKIIKFEGRPFDPSTDVQILVINIISETAFGAKSLTQAEYQKLTFLYKEIQRLSGNTPGDLATWLLILYYNRDVAIKNMAKGFGQFLREKYDENKKTFEKGEIRNFSDALITSRIEAEDEENDAKQYLDDNEMMKIMGALFIAATETTATTLRWMLIIVANFPEVQEKMRDEIKEHIGHRMPMQADRKNCPYIWAFMAECMRFRTAAPVGVPHAANVDTELGGHKIKKGSVVVFHAEAVHMDSKIWPEPEKFKPERFLKTDGTFNNDRTGFLAFGEGKRICVGEKMARNDIFLVLTNLLQKVKIKLDGPSGSADFTPKSDGAATLAIPKNYKIIVESLQ